MYLLRRLPPFFSLPLLLLLGRAAAQPSTTQEYAPTAPESLNNFQPSLAVVIGILSIMFSVTFILLVYAKFCHRGSSAAAQAAELLRQQGLARSASRFSGIDKTVIESLPFFRFSSLRGDRDGLECAVCISKFEDVEILRLLPQCKHAFHINCIDQWLEKHSSCPICRAKVNAEDPTVFAYSNSMRMMWSQSTDEETAAVVEADRGISAAEDELGLFVQREESGRRSSSRFSIGGSFRKAGSKSGRREDQTPILEETGDDEENRGRGKIGYHKFNHRIVVSDLAFKNRWSSVSSSDLMFLRSEMLNDAAGERFFSLDQQLYSQSGGGQHKLAGAPPAASSNGNNYLSADANAVNYSREIVNSAADRRAVSELTGVSRFRSLGVDPVEGMAAAADEERQRQAWIPIVRRTAEWFANREKRKTAAETVDV
ncbi:unnamed protein product [Linum trigynum]|uniref:RING-type E3 ubiquitin transferase n=1 Tax=Linum trigynum TaxID=586398 RepID=A0AAV2CSP2_9ROSI